MSSYFSMKIGDESRWHLQILEKFTDGSAVNIWAYRCRALSNPKPVPFRIQVEGKRVDFNPTAFSAIVASRRMADAIEAIAPMDIQRIPAIIEGQASDWEVVNILHCVDCIDYERSLIQYYPANHPTKPGKPRGIIRLELDPSRISGVHVFHPEDWQVATIVSDVLKGALESICASGIEYVLVADAATWRNEKP